VRREKKPQVSSFAVAASKKRKLEMETSPKQNIIRLNYNQPIVISLKYPTGKEVQGTWGKQLLFITGSGHRLYAPPILQDKLTAAGIKAGEKFMLTKARLQNGHGYRVEWQVVGYFQRVTALTDSEKQRPPVPEPLRGRVPGGHETQQSTGQPAIQLLAKTSLEPAYLDESKPLPESLRRPLQSSPTRLEAALKTAVSAAHGAERYGQEIGYNVRFSPADIRAMGISVLIAMGNGNGRAA